MTELSCAVQEVFISVRFHGVSEFFKTEKSNQNQTMKIKWIICSALAAALLSGCVSGKCCKSECEKKEHHNQEAKLMAEAKVSKADAEKTALAKAPNGTIKEAEIEKEHGKLIWSFDITTPDTKDITEVAVDAMTGEVVAVEKESAENEARETAKEKCEDKEVPVTLTQLSEPARATVEKVTAGGKIEQMTKEVERGKTVYDVEAEVDGKHLEFLIADTDGAVLGTEVPIAYGELPEAVRAAAEKYFGTASGLKAMKGVEFGETTYEIEGTKNGKTVEATFDPEGKPAK
jgi:uncharacterized membrane protein YkoI